MTSKLLECLQAFKMSDRPSARAASATHTGAELDLLIVRGHEMQDFEFKYSSAPKPTRAMLSALQDFGLDRITIVCPGRRVFADRSYPRDWLAGIDGGSRAKLVVGSALENPSTQPPLGRSGQRLLF